MIVGDTHGNTDWMRQYIYPVAMTLQADAVVVLGDFGAWEHTSAGVQFMDDMGALATTTEIPLYWLHGNHDKFSHTVEHYQPDGRGFLVCRESLFYIPQGHTWMWEGVSFRSFGGAYSIDKAWRVQREQENFMRLMRKAGLRKEATGKSTVVPRQDGTLWFPEEQMTDADMTELLEADNRHKDIVLSHDKPYSAKPQWNRKDLPGCLGNQLRLERALRAHQPLWWFHGHLHYAYRDNVYGGTWGTTVVGLEPDGAAAEAGWKSKHTWAVADLVDGKATVKSGLEMYVDKQQMAENILSLR